MNDNLKHFIFTANNNGTVKKMSLDEFLGDDSLLDSVWNEDEINLDAISNTTNIDILKNSYSRENHDNDMAGSGKYHNDYYGNNNNHRTNYNSSHGGRNNYHSQYGNDFRNNDHYSSHNDPHSYPPQEPNGPYIVKFSNLPPRFADRDIVELFQGKFTKFVKFKVCWELNRHPTINQIKNGTIFEQNFKREVKVAFVEVYTNRDLNKIIKYWKRPLKDIYDIDVVIAQFEDFKEYMSKFDLLTDPMDDPSKPYTPPKPKLNPFGKAKPVDTQSKILDIEEKMEKFHVEDTETLRKLTLEETPNSSLLKKEGIKLAQKPVEKKKPLSYSQVLERAVNSESQKDDDNIKTVERRFDTKLENTQDGYGQTNLNTNEITEVTEFSKKNEEPSTGENKINEKVTDTIAQNTVNEDTETEKPENDQIDVTESEDGQNFQFKYTDKQTIPNTDETTKFTPKVSHQYNNRRGGYSNNYGGNNRGNRGGYNTRRGNFRGRGNSYQNGYNPNFRHSNNNFIPNSENDDSINTNNNDIAGTPDDKTDIVVSTDTVIDNTDGSNENKNATTSDIPYDTNNDISGTGEQNPYNKRGSYNKNYNKGYNKNYNSNYNSKNYNAGNYNNYHKKSYNKNYDNGENANSKDEGELLFKPASGFLYNKRDDSSSSRNTSSSTNRNQNNYRGRHTTRRGRGGTSRGGGSRYNK